MSCPMPHLPGVYLVLREGAWLPVAVFHFEDKAQGSGFLLPTAMHGGEFTYSSTEWEKAGFAACFQAHFPASGACQWTEVTGWTWETSCGATHAFSVDGPEENGAHFCCYCGRVIAAVALGEGPSGLDVWLDDVRDPREHGCIGWTWVKTAEDAIRLLASGKVRQISLDHDLDERASIGEAPVAPTGYTVAVYMEENRIWPPNGAACHSQNPVGRARIEAALQSARRRAGR